MEFKSPQLKKPKFSSEKHDGNQKALMAKASFDDLRDDLNKLVTYRQSAPSLINELYSARTQDSLKCLVMTEIKLGEHPTYAVPNIEEAAGNWKRPEELGRQMEEMYVRCTEQNRLLKVVELKYKCPVAKIINDI